MFKRKLSRAFAVFVLLGALVPAALAFAASPASAAPPITCWVKRSPGGISPPVRNMFGEVDGAARMGCRYNGTKLPAIVYQLSLYVCIHDRTRGQLGCEYGEAYATYDFAQLSGTLTCHKGDVYNVTVIAEGINLQGYSAWYSGTGVSKRINRC